MDSGELSLEQALIRVIIVTFIVIIIIIIFLFIHFNSGNEAH